MVFHVALQQVSQENDLLLLKRPPCRAEALLQSASLRAPPVSRGDMEYSRRPTSACVTSGILLFLLIPCGMKSLSLSPPYTLRRTSRPYSPSRRGIQNGVMVSLSIRHPYMIQKCMSPSTEDNLGRRRFCSTGTRPVEYALERIRHSPGLNGRSSLPTNGQGLKEALTGDSGELRSASAGSQFSFFRSSQGPISLALITLGMISIPGTT